MTRPPAASTTELAKMEWARGRYGDARGLLKLAVDIDCDGEAARLMALCCMNGYLCMPQSMRTGLEYARRAADLGDGVGMYMVANSGYEDAHLWHKKTREHASVLARGMWYTSFGVTPEQRKMGFKLMQEAAEDGDMMAQAHLGEAYNGQFGVNKNEELAFYWNLKAAYQGHAGAQRSVAMAFDAGRCVHESPIDAFRWFHKAAYQGQFSSQHIICQARFKGFLERENARLTLYHFLLIFKHHKYNITYNCSIKYNAIYKTHRTRTHKSKIREYTIVRDAVLHFPYDLAKLIARELWKTNTNISWQFPTPILL